LVVSSKNHLSHEHMARGILVSLGRGGRQL